MGMERIWKTGTYYDEMMLSNDMTWHASTAGYLPGQLSN